MIRGDTASSAAYHEDISPLGKMCRKNTAFCCSCFCCCVRFFVSRGDIALLFAIHFVGFVVLCKEK